VEVIANEDKFWRLMELLGEWYDKGSILLFVDKQLEADELFKELYKVGYKALVLHGGQDQTDREFTIQDFKDRVRNIMVATSVCARGLDISHLRVVINYICPNHLEDYVHRVGRTGRAGIKGTAYTFIS
jgi:ATP-dependent RNA helicase DDX46/PRP5